MQKIRISFYSVLLISLSVFFYCCNKKAIYFETSKEAINDVKTRFPTLIYSNNKIIKEISKRKISINNDSIEINLIEFEGDDDENKILVFKNKENQYYAIPIFSTLHRDYWEFKNDKTLKKFPIVNSNFKTEFLNMLVELKFNNDDLRILNYETFQNVLEWKFIYSKEELLKEKNIIYMSGFNIINNDESKTSLKRINKNIDTLIKSFKQYQTQIVLGGGIIIEFVNYEDFRLKKKPLIINCYRQDSNIELLSL